MNIKTVRLQADVIDLPPEFSAYYQRRLQQEKDLPRYMQKFLQIREVNIESFPDNLFLLLSSQLEQYMENDEFALKSLEYKLRHLSDRETAYLLQLSDKFQIPPFADLCAKSLAHRVDRMSADDLSFIFGPKEALNEDMARIKMACDTMSDLD